MPSALIADEDLADKKDSQSDEETQTEAIGSSVGVSSSISRETQPLPLKKSKKETEEQLSQRDSAVKPPPKRPGQQGRPTSSKSAAETASLQHTNQPEPPQRPNQGGPAPQTDSPPQRPNQGGSVAGSPPKRPDQGGSPQGAGAGGAGAMPTVPQSETPAQMEVQAKQGPSVFKHVIKIIFGFGLVGAVAWFVILPLAGIGGSDFLLGSRQDAAPLPMVKPDPESLKVDGLRLEKGDVLTALKGTLKNTGSSTFRNVKITFRMMNSENAPEEFSHTVNQEISGGASVQFSTSITFEPSDGAAPEVINIDSDEQLAQ